MKRSLYDVLGIEDSSDCSTIKKAYKNLALKYHPDKTTSSSASPSSSTNTNTTTTATSDHDIEFIEIKDAYETLIDPTKKLSYDKRTIIDSFVLKHESEILGSSPSIFSSSQSSLNNQPNNCKNVNNPTTCSNILHDIINNSFLTTPEAHKLQAQNSHHGHGYGHGYGHHHHHHGMGGGCRKNKSMNFHHQNHYHHQQQQQQQQQSPVVPQNIYTNNVVINNNFSNINESNRQSINNDNNSNLVKGSNINITLNVTFEESIDGCEKCIEFERLNYCDCITKLSTTNININGGCRSCKNGLISVMESFKVEVPAGLNDGYKVIYNEMGNAGGGGGNNSNSTFGDLIVLFKVEEHNFFSRNGLDVNAEINISFIDAILGARITVPFLYGSMQVDIPPGTQPNQMLKIKNQGFQSISNNQIKGDYFLRIQVEIPKSLSLEQTSLLLKFKELK